MSHTPKDISAEQQALQDETAAIANRLKAELGENRGFILIAFHRDGGTAPDSKLPGFAAWASRRIGPSEVVHLLQEYLHVHQRRANTYGEPSAQLSCIIRDAVAGLLDKGGPGNPHPFIEAFNRARKDASLPAKERLSAFLGLTIAAMAEYEQLRRKMGVQEQAADGGWPSRAQIDRRMAELMGEIERSGGPRTWPLGDTKTTLVNDLLALPESQKREALLEKVREGVFHDYDSDLPMPKVALIQALIAFGYEDLARKAMEGGYDDDRPSVVQGEELRQRVGADFFDSLTGKDPGDGVYATFDGYHIWLKTGSHRDHEATNQIALEPSVFAELVNWQRKLAAALAQQEEG